MKFSNIFKVFKKNKSYNSKYYQPFAIGIHNKLINSGNYDIASSYASSYYKNVQPTNDAINRIATALGSIKPKIWDNEKEMWTDHEVLQLLRAPDPDLTWRDFFSNSGRWLMITGNANWVIGGDVEKKPIEIRIANPQHVTAQGYDYDSYASVYELNEPWGSSEFVRFEKNKERQFRYYRHDKMLEFYHIKDFTTDSDCIFGLSPLNPIYYEMEQYLALSIHNLALMKNGSRTGLLIKVEHPLSKDQEDRLHSEIDQIYSGEYNANRTLILSGAMSAEDLGKSNKDMDYIQLRKNILDGIYSTFKIPLPMVSSSCMTLSNYSVSQLMLYDHTIEPYANKIFEELTRMLMPRYGDTEGRYSITFDDRDISALESRRNDQVNVLKNVGVLTTNELRIELGYNKIESKEGDSILIPQNLKHLDDNTEEKIQENFNEIEEEKLNDEEEKSYINQFTSILKSYKNNGKQLFDDDEIYKLSKTFEETK